MTSVLVATEKPFAAIAVEDIKKIIREAGFEFRLLEKYSDKADLLKAVKDVDALIVRSDLIDREVMGAADSLKIVVRAGSGYDNIDLTAASEKKIVVMNTPGQNANAVAELAIGMMVYFARNMFNGKPGTELRGKTLGIHAYGNVGKQVAAIARGFGMQVFAFDPYIPEEVIMQDGVTCLNSLEELYRTCQYVSVHIPANETTRKCINEKLLSMMPKNAVLVNTARKEVICEDSLKKVFAARNDFGYVSDIAPDCLGELEAQFAGRFYCTPKKMGAQTAEANINAGLAAARQIVRFIKDSDTTFQVNK